MRRCWDELEVCVEVGLGVFFGYWIWLVDIGLVFFFWVLVYVVYLVKVI